MEANDTYLGLQRHVLADLHIPDWDDGFLAQFDPSGFVDLIASTGAQAAVVFCNSHSGECFWPTTSGKVHERLGGRDFVGEQVDRLHHHGLAACAYYSFNFNNWAYTAHPEWRIVPAGSGAEDDFGRGTRYGLCCPANPDYLEFMVTQSQELAVGYRFDAFFYDMVFWPDVCVCLSCRDRYRREEGAEIPTVVDWYSKDWCQFQAARGRWLTDAYRQIRDRIKDSLNVPVFLNSAALRHGWSDGMRDDIVAMDDLIAGDFLGAGSFAMLAMYAQLTPTIVQYMNNISGYCSSASQLKSVGEQKVHALSATAFGGQFMAIDAVGPDGSVNPAAYERLAEVFNAMKPYESYLGGAPVIDIAVYWSLQGNVDFSENGTPLNEVRLPYREAGPHLRAVLGAVAALAEVHLPVGVITRAALERLDAYAAIVLPNVMRMDAEEIAAIRGYVERGGRVYASGYTSLVTVEGMRHEDFLLADVFGAHFAGEEASVVTYLKPATDEALAWVAPVNYVTHGEPFPRDARFATSVTALRISSKEGADVVATTTLPYAEGRGTRDDTAWASIHTSPPWQDTEHPAVIRHRFGKGEAVYSALDLESAGAAAGPAAPFFVGLIRSLIARELTFEAETHPDAWVTVFHDVGEDRLRICFLNHALRFPSLPIPRSSFRLAAPSGTSFIGLERIPTGESIPFTLEEDGSLHAVLSDLETFDMLAASYR